MSWRGRVKSAHDDAMSSRNGATSTVIRATSRVIDAMSASSGAMSERGDATGEISAAMAGLAGAMGRRGASIATNGVATRARCIAIEKQVRAIAMKALAIERFGNLEGAHLSVDEGVNHPKAKTGEKHHHPGKP
jgi:hypothetical protein